ncbi:MAG: aryl-sulfate sulfotransferase [Lewinellaceae bacterium]|nr:aryl-sulfate sulfotransferase [Lewinellaceae bacterium]
MAFLKSFISNALFLPAFVLSAQNVNRPVPKQLPPYEFVRFDTSYHGYYLTAPFRLGGNAGDIPEPAMILDADGYLAWYMQTDARSLLDFKYFPEYQQYSYILFHNPDSAQFMLMDTGFQPVDSFTTVNGFAPDPHEFQITSNQTYWVAGISDSVMDLSAYLFNGVPGSANTHAVGFVVQEFDEDHNLIFQWNSNDHIHPSKAYLFYGYNPANFDYCHGNSVTEDSDGHLLISFRHLNAVYKINRFTGQIIWELGGKTSSFSFPNDPGFSGQHDARRLPNGNIALFDNANMAAPPKRSRAVEYSLDTVNWIAQKVWEYQYNPGFFAVAMGNHQTTESRLHLVNFGLNFRPNPSFVLTDDAGNLLSELFFQDSSMSYRSSISDIPFDDTQRPAINCTQNGSTITLSAAPGYDRYEWSTGAESQSITLSLTGVYQVWVNYGAGMIGSEPRLVSSLADACAVSSVETPDPGAPPAIDGYFDLLGRKMERPEKGRLYVIRYKNGWSKILLRQE